MNGGTDAGHHTAAEQPSGGGRCSRIDGSALARVDEGLFGERADAQCGREVDAIERHLLGGVEGGEAVPRLALEAATACAAHGPPVQYHEVAGLHVGNAGADRLHHACSLVAEQEGEVVVNPTLSVVKVGMADAAGLHLHQSFAGARIGYHDGFKGDGCFDAAAHDCPYFVRHQSSCVGCSPPFWPTRAVSVVLTPRRTSGRVRILPRETVAFFLPLGLVATLGTIIGTNR